MKDKKLSTVILNGVALAMGICVFVLSILNEIGIQEATLLLSIGLIVLSINPFKKNKTTKK